MQPRPTLVLSLLALATFATACAGPLEASENDETTAASEDHTASIVRGQAAPEHEEAVLLDIQLPGKGDQWASCSGALIAPRVVLTAGHCIAGSDVFRVTLPYSSDTEAVTARSKAVFDYPSQSETVARDKHDIGLVFLDEPRTLKTFPVLASTPLADGALIVNVGRKQDGQHVSLQVFESAPVPARDAAFRGSPFAYSAERLIERGDSGGPAVLHDVFPRVIVGVASGTGKDYALLARVDLLKTWIDEQIDLHGGPAATAGQPCNAEAEPNNTAREGNPLKAGSSVCGELETGDVDWYTFRGEASGTPLAARLTGIDAEMTVWKQVGKVWEKVRSLTPTAVDVSAVRGARYVVEVRSRRGASGAYRLSWATRLTP